MGGKRKSGERRDRAREEQRIDEEVEASFPASDPPARTITGIGSPRDESRRTDSPRDDMDEGSSERASRKKQEKPADR